MEISEGARPPEAEKPPVTVGEATLNGKKFLFGSRTAGVDLRSKFTFFDPETKKEVASAEQVNLSRAPIHSINDVHEKSGIYGEVPKATTPSEFARNLLIRTGYRERPIVGTRTILSQDAELTQRSNADLRPGSSQVHDPLWGWELTINHSTPPEVLDKLGIKQEDLYEGYERENEKRLTRAFEILAANPGWQERANRAKAALNATPGGDVLAGSLTPEYIAEIESVDPEALNSATKGEVKITNWDTLVPPKSTTSV